MSPINADSRNDTCGPPPDVERRVSTYELARQMQELVTVVDQLRRERDADRKAREEDRQLLHVLLLFWGINPKDPESVARAYSSRLKVIDAGKIGRTVLIVVTSGGFAAMLLAALNFWRSMK